MTTIDNLPEPTVGDAYDLSDGADRDQWDALLEEGARAIFDRTDEERVILERVRTGGHTVQLCDRPGRRPEVLCSIYATGKRYGGWHFAQSPDGDRVEIDHYLPLEYDMRTGGWLISEPHKSWTISIDAWLLHGADLIDDFVGKRVGAKVHALLPIE